MSRRVVVAFLFAFALAVVPESAWACAMCGNGALSPREDEVGTFRGTIDFKYGSASSGNVFLSDRRLDLILGFAPIRALEIDLDLPGFERTVRGPGALTTNATLPGDVELRAIGTLWQAHGSASERLAMVGGIKFPTAPIEHDPTGAELPSLLQPGCSSIVPNLGIVYAFVRGPWGFVTTAALYLPFAVRAAPHGGESLRSTGAFDIHANKWLTMRTGISLQVEPSGELAPGKSDPNSGGFVGQITGELLVQPARRFNFGVGLYAPVVQVLRGTEHIGSTFDAHLAAAF